MISSWYWWFQPANKIFSPNVDLSPNYFLSPNSFSPLILSNTSTFVPFFFSTPPGGSTFSLLVFVQVSRSVMKFHQDKAAFQKKLKREENARLKRIAGGIAKEVKQFWRQIEKVNVMPWAEKCFFLCMDLVRLFFKNFLGPPTQKITQKF